jgi:hypothetical protein
MIIAKTTTVPKYNHQDYKVIFQSSARQSKIIFMLILIYHQYQKKILRIIATLSIALFLIIPISAYAQSNFFDDNQINNDTEIPDWIKINANWWAEEKIDDATFLEGIKFLINERIMFIPPSEELLQLLQPQEIPDWIKTNANWWADGEIDDNSFVSGING